jgi:hypothetical protein
MLSGLREGSVGAIDPNGKGGKHLKRGRPFLSNSASRRSPQLDLRQAGWHGRPGDPDRGQIWKSWSFLFKQTRIRNVVVDESYPSRVNPTRKVTW